MHNQANTSANAETVTLRKARAKAEKLARLADPASNGTEAERATALQKLIELCERHGFNLSDFVKPVASPESGEQPEAPKADPKPEAPKAEPKAKRAKASAKPQTKAEQRDAERERAQANRAATMRHYSGASQASHASRAPKLSDAIERVRNPIQRAKSASERDASALVLATKHANGQHDFCPVAGTFDLGVLSRLASLGMLAVAPCGNKLRITKPGRDLAALTLKKAA